MEKKAEQVRHLVQTCLFKDEEIVDGKPPKGAVLVDGITRKFGFHPERLDLHKDAIREVLADMPDEFHHKNGGGQTFLNMCCDRHGVHWGEHPIMDDLVALGLATNMVKFPLPREMWGVLPGGVPYISINLEGFE